MKKIKIFIDPGHGGSDPGAVGNGLREKDLTLSIAKALKKYLEQYENVEVRLSREDDRALTLKQRTDMANAWGADYFISVHVNAGGGTGFESFIWNGGVSSATISNQNVMHSEIMKELKVRDRLKKRANFHVVRETRMPAILPEFMFIDNASDAKLLKDPAFLNKCAKGMENGLVAIFGLKKKATPKPSTPQLSNSTHTIVSGDTFYALANRYNTTVAELQRLNPSVNPSALRIGSTIVVSPNVQHHTVVRGDTVSALGLRYGSTINQIRNWNNLDAKYTIYVGQKLRVK
ncbi:N-acetylmuramoyl-L-alanine amidase [Alkalihalobacillus alcalophilus ATCC 27647 = CGMCC 1.3604]|nr:N-acetylmuramoyl-L-alanine amidase [Alkalihalobacillus alcalophilus]KGA96882.1 N-acetylmuramoyl-L-alanine amidase [Alkalihalobacillus alcalophilus ATCC 27647 = CGMCC 1.3604]MED1561174.1 N-acetylmuramoyl-L-alanine amidase [Alkalihalobacillus alcalophilus]